MIGNSLQSGLNGIHAGVQQLNRSANVIASQGTKPQGLDANEMTTAAVEMIQAEHQVAASASVVKASDDTLGTLLDVIA